MHTAGTGLPWRALLGAWIFWVGASAVPPSPRALANDWKPFELINSYFIGEKGEIPPYLETYLNDGKIGFIHQDEHTTLPLPGMTVPSPSGREGRDRVPRAEPSYLDAMKKRYGRYFKKTERAVLEYEPLHGTWTEIVRTVNTFSEFEILSNGEVLLLCSGTPRKAYASWPGQWMHFDDFEAGFHFLERYERGVAGPATMPRSFWLVPTEVADICRAVSRVPVFDRMVPFDDLILILNSFTGSLYLLDLKSNRLEKVPTPWESLDYSYLSSNFILLPSLKGPESRVKIPRDAFPYSISVYPMSSTSATLIARMNNDFPPGRSAELDLKERAVGNRFAPVLREFTPEEIARGKDTFAFELDLAGRRIKESSFTLDPTPLLTCPVRSLWLDPYGTWIPLEILKGGRMDSGALPPEFESVVPKVALPELLAH